MTNTLIRLSKPLPQDMIDIYNLVNETANDLGIKYMVVGATARDLIMDYGMGAKIERATRDLDFAIQVENWQEFERLKTNLIEKEFGASEQVAHRLYMHSLPIDIVPFGGIADDSSEIAWPPQGDIKMSTLGFEQAYAASWRVALDDDSDLIVNVASPVGMVLLKLISFVERSHDKRLKDAADILFLIENYEQLPGVIESLFEQDIMDKCDHEMTVALAMKIGLEIQAIVTQPTVNWILRHYIEQDYSEILVRFITERVIYSRDDALNIVKHLLSSITGELS